MTIKQEKVFKPYFPRVVNMSELVYVPAIRVKNRPCCITVTYHAGIGGRYDARFWGEIKMSGGDA